MLWKSCCACSLALLVAWVAPSHQFQYLVFLLAYSIQFICEGLGPKLVWDNLGLMITEQLSTDPRHSKVYPSISPADSKEAAICKVSMLVPLVDVPNVLIFDTADPVTTEERLGLYVEACLKVYQSLGARQRSILERMSPTPGDPAQFLPRMRPNQKWDSVEAYFGMKAQRSAEAERRPDLQPRWKPEAEMGADFQPYVPHGMRPVKEERIEASEIPDAVLQGRTAVFDARDLLPGELFNLTMSDIASAHGQQANDIPMYRQKGASSIWGGWVSLSDMALMHAAWRRDGHIYNFEAMPWDAVQRQGRGPKYKRQEHWLVKLLKGLCPKIVFDEIDIRSRMLTQVTVNTRRLEGLRQVQGLEGRLGSPDWLERTWSMFWTGATGNWMHLDEPDNLLINIRGEMYVSVWNQNDTDLLNGARNHHAMGWDLNHDMWAPHWVNDNEWAKKYPFIHLKLEPGQGVVVPSRTYHSIYSPEGDRILLNCFMMPKYGALENTTASRRGGFWHRENQEDLFWALYHLKTSSIYNLWDTRKVGGFFEMFKFELL